MRPELEQVLNDITFYYNEGLKRRYPPDPAQQAPASGSPGAAVLIGPHGK